MKYELNKIHNCDCIEGMSFISDNYVDLTITSPPYDNLRTYNNSSKWDFDIFKQVADALYRITKKGGVLVWIVSDATIKGSETGTSFKQALYFKSIGFYLHDTMIYAKKNYVPLTHNRYEQEFEYMFVFSKGRPRTFNPIKVECKYAGMNTWGKPTFHKTSSSGLTQISQVIVNDYKIKGNIFSYRTGKVKNKGIVFPAPFPEELVDDMIKSWSNEGDIVFDCFSGSGTTAAAAYRMSRNYLGFEIDKQYWELGNAKVGGKHE